MTAHRARGFHPSALLLLVLLNCSFDSNVEVLTLGHRLVIHDPAPADADCDERSHEMMWLVHRFNAEATRRFPGLPITVNSNVMTPNGNVCEYITQITMQHRRPIATLPWFVLAMDESGWVAECERSMVQGTAQGIFPAPPIRFVRGQAGCSSGD